MMLLQKVLAATDKDAQEEGMPSEGGKGGVCGRCLLCSGITTVDPFDWFPSFFFTSDFCDCCLL